jgi:hypothetical protein
MPEFECSVRPDKVVIAAEQFDVIFKMFLPLGLTDRLATQIGRALPNGQIQPFHKRGVQFH